MEPARIRGPLTLLGLMAGLLIGGVVLPRGCAYSPAEAERLHLVMPFAAPLALYLMARWLEGPLARSHGRAWRWVVRAVLALAAADALIAIAAGVAYRPVAGIAYAPIAVLEFWPVHASVLAVGLAVVVRARAAARATAPRSFASSAAERQVWAMALAGVATMPVVVWAIERTSLFLPLSCAAFTVAVIATLALSWLAATERRKLARLIELGVAARAPLGSPEGAHPFRAAGQGPIAGASITDEEWARRAVRDTTLALMVACLTIALGAWLLGHSLEPPAPPPAGTFSLSHGC